MTTVEPVGEARSCDTNLYSDGSLTIEAIINKYMIGRSTLYNFMKSGALPFAQVNGKRLIPVRAVEKMLADATVVTAKEGGAA